MNFLQAFRFQLQNTTTSILKYFSLRSLCSVFFLAMIQGNLVYGQDVDPLTGRAIISISLAKVSVKDLSVSVGLNHIGTSLRVGDGPGNAGMGWSLSMGGAVSREVRGLPDEYTSGIDSRKGWLQNSNAQNIQNFTPSADDNLGVCTDENTDWTFINSFSYLNDPEPDIFYFNAPGLSGKFIFGSDGLPKLIPFQDVTITGSISSIFTITTNTGVVYTFSQKDQSSRQAIWPNISKPITYWRSDYYRYQTPLNYTSTWSLTSIQSPSGATISYTYQQGEQQVGVQYVTNIKPTLSDTAHTNQADTLYFVSDTATPSYLSQIALGNYQVSVSWANSMIDKLTVTELETTNTKEFDFVYKSISSSTDPHSPKISKPFLTQIRQQNSCIPFPSYAFIYDQVDTVNSVTAVPWRTNWGSDFFGYYNASNSNKSIPTVYFYQSESGARRLRVTPISGQTATRIYNGVKNATSNVNIATVSYGALLRIDYPTGGATLYSYEPNKYFDSSTGETLYGPGVRVSSVTTYANDIAYGKATKNQYHIISKQYDYSNADNSTVSSGRILYPPSFAFTDGTSVYRMQSGAGLENAVRYTRVKEIISGRGYRVYLYDLPNMYPDATTAATSSKVARSSTATCSAGLLKNGAYTFPFAPLKDIDFQRGYLTKVTEYSQSGAVTQEKRMSYIMPQSSASLKGLRFEAITDAQGKETFHYSTYQIPYAQSRILSQTIVKQVGDQSQADSTKVTTAYSYNSKNMVTQVAQTNDDGSLVNTYTKYAMDYVITSPTAGDTAAIAINKLNLGNRYGEVVESYQTFTPIGGTAVYSGGQVTVYRDYGSSVFPYRQKHFPQGFTLTPSYASTGSTQSFVPDTDYVTDATLYYSGGLLASTRGVAPMYSAKHYSPGTSLPLATFANCKAEHAVYEGFDHANQRGLYPSGAGPSATPAGWTGAKAMQLDPTFTLLTTSTVTKGGNYYRLSYWVLPAQGGTITVNFKNGGLTQLAKVISHTTSSQWSYQETFVNLSSVSSTFTLEVKSSATIVIDDFILLPKGARVSSQTYLPLTGTTSVSDDRGNSTVTTYDVMGRAVNTFDKQRNLVAHKDYGLAKQGHVVLNANFSSNAVQYVAGSAVIFTAASNCVSTSYQWVVTDNAGNATNAGTGSTLTYTFPSFGSYSVKLTVANASYPSVSFTDNICVTLPSNLQVSITASPSADFYRCNADGAKTFTALLGWGVNLSGLTVAYTWTVTDSNGAWTGIQNMGGTQSNNTATYNSPYYTYTVRCDVSVSRPQTGNDISECNVQQYKIGSAFLTVTYHDNRPCQ